MNTNFKGLLQRFEILFEKNQPERGGSFYIQSKIFFAKQQLMIDFPEELNQSKFNPDAAPEEEEEDKESEQADKESEKSETDGKSAADQTEDKKEDKK